MVGSWWLSHPWFLDRGPGRSGISLLIVQTEAELRRGPKTAAARVQGAWFKAGEVALDEGRHDEAAEAFRKSC